MQYGKQLSLLANRPISESETSCYSGEMRFQHVCLEAFGYTLPDEVVTTSQLEARLQPLYDRLRLPAGRLELITGVRERRFWEPGTTCSSVSIESCQRAMEAANLDIQHIGALIHASVCRDHLEPATACSVHHGLGLPAACQIFDLSNACLGLMNGVLQLATMIECGQIQAGLVVGTESGRQLVETTVDTLNNEKSLTRKSIKGAIASLTIGSGSCAILVTHRDISKSQNRLLGGSVLANTTFHELCQSGADEVGSGMTPLMETDSEQLMREGCATGAANFEQYLNELAWSREDITKTVCHQVGPAHRKMMFESLGMDVAKDFSTVELLGNTGSVALPTAMAIAAQQGHFEPDDNVGMFGIGSGINCVMLGCEWQKSIIGTATPLEMSELASSS